MTARSLIPAIASLFLSLAIATSATHADTVTEWNQETVSAIAQKFATQTNDIYRSIVRKNTGATMGSGQAHSFLRLKDKMRVVRSESRHLERQLEEGKGHDETVMVFERMMSLIRSARDDASRMFLEKKTLDKIAAARASLLELVPYYDPALVKGIEAQAERRR